MTYANYSFEDAVIDGLMCCHIYTKKHNTDPRKALNDLISWHVQVALDPQVSSDAQALIDRGRKQELLILRKIFMDQHEEFKHQHNFWHVAANAIGMRLV